MAGGGPDGMLRQPLRDRLLLVGLAAAFGIAALAGGALAGAAAAMWLLDERASVVPPVAERGLVAERASAGLTGFVSEDDLVLSAVRATRPAVVTVANLQTVRRTWRSPARLQEVGSGSGVIFDDRGYVATNHHVIQGAQGVEVVFLDGRRVQASVVGTEPNLDVAVLKLPEGTELPAVAPLADSSALEPGMRVLAIGSPLGTQYQNTVTTGIIAGLNRRVREQSFDLNTFTVREYDANAAPLIQTDAAINTGNSGGPLIDLDGEVVGLNTLIVRSNPAGGMDGMGLFGQSASRGDVEGLGFAVPSNVVQMLADEWVDGQSRGWLGIEWETIDPALAREYGLARGSGAILKAITPGGAAERAGLAVGDVIVAVDDLPLDLDRALADVLWRYRAGDRIRVTYERGGKLVDREIVLDGR